MLAGATELPVTLSLPLTLYARRPLSRSVCPGLGMREAYKVLSRRGETTASRTPLLGRGNPKASQASRISRMPGSRIGNRDLFRVSVAWSFAVSG
jgi:hypothetical protein